MCIVPGAQVQAAAPPVPLPLKEPEVSAVSSTTNQRTLPSQEQIPHKPSVLQVNCRSNVVVVNDTRFINGSKICEKNLNSMVTNEPQKLQTRPKPDDLNIQLNYDHSIVVNNNYHRMPINDTSSRRNHERHYEESRDKLNKDVQQSNGFIVPNEAVSAKSYPLKEEIPHSNGASQVFVPEEVKMEVEDPMATPLGNGRQNGFDLPKTDCEKDLNVNRLREDSPGKESNGMDRSHHKDHQTYDHLAVGADGSVRSDEGYHSHGYHDEVLTPPEDSSDSDDSENNYVLDFRLVSFKLNSLHFIIR